MKSNTYARGSDTASGASAFFANGTDAACASVEQTARYWERTPQSVAHRMCIPWSGKRTVEYYELAVLLDERRRALENRIRSLLSVDRQNENVSSAKDQ